MGLNETSVLTELHLRMDDIFSALENPHNKLQKMICSCNCIDEAATRSLKIALIANSTVKAV